ncbi:hypothetical protein ACTXG7_27215 [Mycolicibacterium sp. Dal123E01]|uniref:hypothetical protein n=1 Tax=Mycolicibacterium sp. Dal123E01 TaxID=3457578 RepID=UPI00403E3EDB
MLATGVSLTTAATIALAPLPTAPPPPTHTTPVVLANAWDRLQANVQEDLANLQTAIDDSSAMPILSQVAQNFTTYGRWLQFQDGGNPLKVVQTMGEHVVSVAVTMVSYGMLVPLSFIGPFIAPGLMIAQLIADTSAYPSTPQTVLQALIDAPANYLDITLNCCSTSLFKLAFGLLNPGPLGYLLALGPAIATALQVPTPSWLLPDFTPRAAADPMTPTAAKKAVPAAGVAQSRRSEPDATLENADGAEKTAAARSAKRPAAARKGPDSSAQKATSRGTGQSARPASPEKR